ncbi:pyrroline-5-carboxylate reductase family protein [Brevundimonas sp.]|uniref:pyrroline-5-carboxylate reductase family protein n=1 Tax=Brevundimonas sp. TaxID=1871086 RepID=UPI0035B1F6CC
MCESAQTGPVILLGCGRLGSAVLEGWLNTGAVVPKNIIVLTPSTKPMAEDAAARGARLNPPVGDLAEASALVIAVKPAKWRDALLPLLPHLAADVALVSAMAGVKADDIAMATNRAVVRVMPTTAVAQASGVAAVWAEREHTRAVAHSLFEPLADVVDLADEDQMDAATAVAGSAPAFIYAFARALARAGEARGLSPDAAARLATGALRSAGAGAGTGAPLSDLIARIASPGGTTQAGLEAMGATGDLDRAAEAAVKFAVYRAGELSA